MEQQRTASGWRMGSGFGWRWKRLCALSMNACAVKKAVAIMIIAVSNVLQIMYFMTE